MEKVTLGEGILSALFIIASIIRFFQNRNATKQLEQAAQNSANSAVIKVGAEGELTRKQVKEMVDAAITATVNERTCHTDFMQEVRSSIETLNVNVKRVCAHNGIEWKDPVTTVPDHTRKKS